MIYIVRCKYAIGKKLLLVILFYIFSHDASAFVKVKFNKVDVPFTISNSNITSIFQDKLGFLWVGTQDGLNRFDGYGFKVYRNQPGDTNSLLKNIILFIYEDSRGILWVSTANGGLHVFNEKSDNFSRVSGYSFDCEIAAITEDSHKNIWIAGIKSRKAFVAKLDKSTGRWENHVIFPSYHPIISFIQASENEFWIGVKFKGFYKWNKRDNTLISYLPDKNNPGSIISNNFHCAIKDKKGNIWIGTKDGLSKFNMQNETFTNYTTEATTDHSQFSIKNIWELCEDGDYIWIGTENEGLCRLDTKSNGCTRFQFDKNDPTSLASNSIWAIFRDFQGRIWIGTYSKGLCVMDKLREKFSELDISLENDVVNALWQDSKKRFWVGTEEGIAVKDGQSTQYYKHTAQKGSLSSNPVLSIFEDNRQRMWIGTWGGGLNRFDEKTKRFIHYVPNENISNSLSNANVFAIKEWSKTGQLLAGTYNGLNVLTNEETGIFEVYKEPKFEFNNYIRTIYEDSKRNVWIGTIEELNAFDPVAKRITRFKETGRPDAAKISGLFNYITEDTKGRLWIGTHNGLYMVINKKLAAHYTTHDGLPNNIVNGILEDANGNLWLSTNMGLSEFNPETKVFKNYDINDGLLSNEFKPGVCIKNADGQLFFGGKGVNVFYPDSIKKNPNVPPVYIVGLHIFNQYVKVGDKDSILKRPIHETKEISLPHYYNFFTIHYVALNFTVPNKNQYANKLEGLNEDWVNVGGQRFATFTNLDPGTYTFRVKACNNDGVWNEEGAVLTIHILPPWWKTWWFRILMFVFVATGIFAVFKIKLARERLKNEIKFKNRELELKNHSLIIYTMRLAEKGRFINEIVESSHNIKNQPGSEGILSIIKKREFSDNDWEEFTMHFESANPSFFKKIIEIAPSLTPNELKLCALLRLNLSSKEISSILRVHPESVIKARYRIRKKLNTESEDNLITYLMNL